VYTTDSLAFLLIIILAAMSERQGLTCGLKMPTILTIVAEDATTYFLVIFTAHLAFELTLTRGPVSMAVSLPESYSTVSLGSDPTSSRPVSPDLIRVQPCSPHFSQKFSGIVV
jgi:hypothetical protein